MPTQKRPVPGDVVVYHDPKGNPHNAICTCDWGGCINLVVVSDDPDKKDQYGRQIERHTSVADRGPERAHGMYWRWPDEAPVPFKAPLST